MGLLQNGQWVDQWYDTKDSDGEFRRQDSRFRNWLTANGEAGAYVRELYQVQGAAETVNFDHIKTHYYASHRTINPTGVVPVGPEQDFTLPHGRETLKAA